MMLVFAQLTASWFLGGPFARVFEDIVHASFVLEWYQFVVLQVDIITIHIRAHKSHVVLRSNRLVDDILSFLND